ncbi:MAG: ATP-binding protein [Acidobacteriota bacterium]
MCASEHESERNQSSQNEQAGNPSEWKRDYSELERQIDDRTLELSLLYDLSRSMNSSLSLDEFLRSILEAIHRISEADLSLIILSFEDRPVIYYYLSHLVEGRELKEIGKSAISLFHDLSGRKVRNEKTVVFRSRDYLPESYYGQSSLQIIHHMPIFRRSLSVGLMAVCSSQRRILNENRIRLLDTVSNQASATLDRFISSLESEQSRFRSVVNSMTEGVVLTDLSGHLLMTNPAADSILFRLRLDRDQGFANSFHDKDLVRSLSDLRKNRIRSLSHEITFHNYQTILNVTASAVLDADERVTGIVWVLSDITRQRQLHEQMMQAEKLSALGEMISGIAHELNNPLTSVMGYAQLLQNASVPKEVKKKLEVINSESKRCQRIVQNLLTFARKYKIEKKWFDLNGAIESVLQIISYQLRVSSIEVKKNYPQDLPRVMGDVHQIQQVLLNIFNNAMQALLEVKRKRKIMIKADFSDGKVLIEIKDNGPGIRKENISKIFDPFFTTKEPGKGTGLGLSIARTTIREHRGEINVVSNVDEGTSFLITLPAAGGVRDKDQNARLPARIDRIPAGKKILIVDDEIEIFHFIEEVLREDGHQVNFASDGRMAVKELKGSAYDLIISDFKMPRMDGKEFFSRVSRKFPHLKDRFIFMTGDTANPATSEFLEKKKVRFILKPFDLEEIRKAIRETFQES